MKANTSSSLIKLISFILISFFLITQSHEALGQDVKTYVHPRAIALMPTIKDEVKNFAPTIEEPWYFPGLFEHESCINLRHSRCWNTNSELKNSRENGLGLGQILLMKWCPNQTPYSFLIRKQKMLTDKPSQVYSITVPDGRQYVGVTSATVDKRLGDHFSSAKTTKRKTTKFYSVLKDIEKNDVKIEILDNCANKQEAIDKEKFHIKRLDTVNNGLNTTIGGENPQGYKFTEKDKQKMSEGQKKRFENPDEKRKTAEATQAWISANPKLVELFSERRQQVVTSIDHRQKMSEIMKKSHQENPDIGKKQSATLLKMYENNDALKEKISRSLGGGPVEVIKDGKVVAIFPSMGTAAKKLELSVGNISSVVSGRRNQTGGYKFKKVDNA